MYSVAPRWVVGWSIRKPFSGSGRPVVSAHNRPRVVGPPWTDQRSSDVASSPERPQNEAAILTAVRFLPIRNCIDEIGSLHFPFKKMDH